MNILHISAAYGKDPQGLYNELAQALREAGHAVEVLTFCQGPTDVAVRETDEGGIRVVRVRTPAVFGVSKIRKGLAFLSLPFFMKRALRWCFVGRRFDLILFEAPPVTLWSTVAAAKRRFGCPAYLMQKDIFPQNAVDLGFFSKSSLPYLYFRRCERKMLKTADAVGCMSEGNRAYLLAHNPRLKPECVELFPNTVKIKPPVAVPDRDAVRAGYGIPQGACVFLFAGNMGAPQHVELLCETMTHFAQDAGVFFVVAGGGTHAAQVRRHIEENRLPNARFFAQMPAAEYQRMAEACCDVGIVTLDPRFTIPNYPSKTLSYLSGAKPIAAATDTHTDYRDLIETQARCGLWADAAKPGDFFRCIGRLAKDAALRAELGANGRRYLAENFDVLRSVRILEKRFLRN